MVRLHFIERRKNMKTKFLAGFITVFVITLLILSGPASAITLGLDNFSSITPDEDSEVSFLAKVDLHTNDRIPLTNVTVLIKYSNGTAVPNASLTFDLAGNIISPTDNSSSLEVQVVSSQEDYSASTAGYGYGYGYDFTDTTTYHNTSFGYGYKSSAGYGYDSFTDNINSGSGATSGEFVYNITWETPQISANTTYKIEMQTFANDGNNVVRYETKAPSTITVVDASTQYATNATTTLDSTTTTVVLNEGSSSVSAIVIPDTIDEDTEVTLDMSALLNDSLDSVTLSRSVNLERQGEDFDYSALLPAGTVIQGNSSWDGKMILPTVVTTTSTAGTMNIAVEMGSTQRLNFSKAVRITLGGMANKSALWKDSEGVEYTIASCGTANDTSEGDLAAGGECYVDSADDTDMLIWTFHFTIFGAYTPTVVSTTHGSGSSTTYVDESVLSSGDTFYLRVLDKIKFGISSANHSLTLKQFNSTMATVKIQSDPITVYLSKGILQEFDVNGDSTKDVKVRYDGIVGGKAAIFLQDIKQTAPTDETPAPITGDVADGITDGAPFDGGITTPDTTTEGKKTFGEIIKIIVLVLLAVVVVLIVVSWLFKRSRKNRY